MDEKIIRIANELRTLPKTPTPPFYIVMEGVQTGKGISLNDIEPVSANKIDGEYVEEQLLTWLFDFKSVTPFIAIGNNDVGEEICGIAVATQKDTINILIDQIVNMEGMPLDVRERMKKFTGILKVDTYEDLVYVLMVANHFHHSLKHTLPVMMIKFFSLHNQRLITNNVYFDNPKSKPVRNVDEKHRRMRERGKVTKSVRYSVLKRDGFQCAFCGASGKEAKLVVDHIVPIARGGNSDATNLQALCLECNTGKGARA